MSWEEHVNRGAIHIVISWLFYPHDILLSEYINTHMVCNPNNATVSSFQIPSGWSLISTFFMLPLSSILHCCFFFLCVYKISRLLTGAVQTSTSQLVNPLQLVFCLFFPERKGDSGWRSAGTCSAPFHISLQFWESHQDQPAARWCQETISEDTKANAGMLPMLI